jgi:L-seryl-tRNA(Ser) seleniumtransferase
MKKEKVSDDSEVLRLLPSVDALLYSAVGGRILPEIGAKHLTVLARAAIDSLRLEIQEKSNKDLSKAKNYSRENLLQEAEKNLETEWENEQNSRLQPVINATGVVIHTNLGRAPLSENAQKALVETASRYCNLEYNLATGKRGKRGERAENLLAKLTGAEDALIVNNCAAAAFLVLTVLANGGEVIISRGELVEIGGDFRVPDVLEQSGATLREVGTTNRTKLSDYECEISVQTRMILRVHPSNYRIVGFTSAPSLAELAELAHRNEFLLYEDAGSGAMFDLSEYGLTDEPIIADSIKAGADVVSFSGDKLLGGVQSGLIVGRGEIIEKLRKHPLYRALRVDKLIYAALEATLESFRRETALQEIPVLQMLSISETASEKRIESFVKQLSNKLGESNNLRFEIVRGKSVVGGGSAPTVEPPTSLLALKHKKMSAAKLEQSLRLSKPPIVTRVLEDNVLIDLRTVSEREEAQILEVITKI